MMVMAMAMAMATCRTAPVASEACRRVQGRFPGEKKGRGRAPSVRRAMYVFVYKRGPSDERDTAGRGGSSRSKVSVSAQRTVLVGVLGVSAKRTVPVDVLGVSAKRAVLVGVFGVGVLEDDEARYIPKEGGGRRCDKYT